MVGHRASLDRRHHWRLGGAASGAPAEVPVAGGAALAGAPRCRARVAAFEDPYLPRNALGKVLRRELRDRLLTPEASPPPDRTG